MRTILVLLLICFFRATALALHPVSISSTIADVHADRIDVDIEVMLEDLVLYHGLAGDEQNRFSAIDLKAAVEKHKPFLLKYFSILDGEGQTLAGEVVEVSTEQIDAETIGQTELMRRTLNFKLRYPLRSQPGFLTFMQTFGGSTSTLPAVMDLHILRNGSFAEPGTQLTRGRPHTVKLDWNEAGNGQRRTLAELRKQRRAQIEQRLGIASYTGLFSFIYINRFEVRHEVLVPLLTLKQWLPIDHQDPDFISVEEQKAAQTKIEAFFQQKQQVTINQQAIQPKVSRISFFGLDINDFALGADPRKVNVAQARVGVIISFPSIKSPEEVTLAWKAYSEFAPAMSSVVLVADRTPERFDFVSLEDTFKWSGQLDSIMIAPVPAETPVDDSQAGKQAIGQLLTNVYRAFDLREDEQVYDALAKSVDGPLLRDLYLRVKRSLIMAEQGGALAHIESVQVEQLTRADGGDGRTLEITWLATSTAEHWGHLHKRTSQYRARLSLVTVDGAWKLARFQLLDEKRLKFETSIRGYDSNP